jgi:alpha-ribazole phosphatase
VTVTILAVRHAPTVAADGPVGRLDVALAGTHAAAADAILAALAADGAPPPAHVWTSPLDRCAGTARLVADRLGLPLTVDDRLLEIDHGAFAGRSFAALAGDPAYRRWLEAWQTEGPPGGESAEAVAARVAGWRATLDHAVHLVVAHAGVVRALHVTVGGLSWPAAMAAPVPHLGLQRFGFDT